MKFGMELCHAQSRFERWMVEDALPVWAEKALDAPGLGFREDLTLDGFPSDTPFKRMRVQARQVYVFSHAHVLGLVDGLDLAAAGMRFMMEHGLREDGGWVRTLGRDGAVLDPAADLYDIAFVLFALAWFARATGEQAPLRQARDTVQWVRANMTTPHGGFYNTLPPAPGHRQQNPHMHLLEAALALYEASSDETYAELAHELVALFRSHFHHEESGTLGEFFDDMLLPAAAEAGTHVEPGHHYEWVWLLAQYTRLLGGNLDVERKRLYEFAEAFGRDPSGTLVLDAVGRDGVARRDTCRLWPQTEVLKAHATMARHGLQVETRIGTGLSTLMDRYLSNCPRGMWHDQFAPAGGGNLATKIPASSFYHIFVAFADLKALFADPPSV